MDENFSSPGGGFVNLDFYERMVCSPGINLVTLLGEASFHQVHGGTTTNVAEPDALVKSYEDEYAELRGRRFYVPLQQARYVGRLPPAARRFRPRRMNSYQRFRDASLKANGMRPSRPVPIPDDMKAEFVEAFVGPRRVAPGDLAREVDPPGADRSLRLPGADLPPEAGLDR